jgi:uncharacterized protein YkwD
MKKTIVAILFMFLLIFGCRKSQVLFTTTEFSVDEILLIHNKERAKYNLTELKIDNELMKSAQEWSENMAKKNRLFHGNTYIKKKFKTSAENIAWGQSKIDELMSDWMNSNDHRSNILNKNFTHVGFGYARTSRGKPYWCAQFGGK